MAMPTRWNPFRSNNRFDLLPEFEDLVRNLAPRGSLARQFETTLEMRLDVHEDDTSYQVKVDIRGEGLSGTPRSRAHQSSSPHRTFRIMPIM